VTLLQYKNKTTCPYHRLITSLRLPCIIKGSDFVFFVIDNHCFS